MRSGDTSGRGDRAANKEQSAAAALELLLALLTGEGR